jgi:hypothetical protein
MALRSAYKNTAHTEKMAATENAADPKIIADGKIIADVKIKAGPKILVDGEIHAATEKQADCKILAAVEISVPGEIPAAMKKPAFEEKPAGLEKQAAAYCLGLAESPAADFLLVWLKSSRSDPRRCDVSLMQSPSEDKTQAALLLWADPLPYCTGCLYRPAMPRNGQNPRGNQNLGGRLKFH